MPLPPRHCAKGASKASDFAQRIRINEVAEAKQRQFWKSPS